MFIFTENDNNTKKSKKNIAITAGGTGGHIFPALTIAKHLINEGYFVFFFTDNKIFKYLNKNDPLLNSEMITIKILNAKNAPRIKQCLMILKDIWRCRCIIGKKISLCIGFGGLITFAPMIVSILTFKKTIIHEQNAVMGLANRLLLPFVKCALLTFDNTYKIKRIFKKKCKVVGNPIREEIKKLVYNYDNPSVNYYAFYTIEDKINLTIIGGSQACNVFDKIIPQTLSLLPNTISNKLFVVHQCKEENREFLNDFYTKHFIDHDVRPFFYNIGELYRSSHLLIARSGSTTIAEISALGVPSILIPLPTATDDHQYKNACFLRDNNGTILLEQQNLTSENLSMLLTDLFLHDNRLSNISQSCRKLAKINADFKIVEIINTMLGFNNYCDINTNRMNVKNIKYINENVGLG